MERNSAWVHWLSTESGQKAVQRFSRKYAKTFGLRTYSNTTAEMTSGEGVPPDREGVAYFLAAMKRYCLFMSLVAYTRRSHANGMYEIAFPLFRFSSLLSFSPLSARPLGDHPFLWADRGCKRFPQPSRPLSLALSLFHLPWPYFRLYVFGTSPQTPFICTFFLEAPFTTRPLQFSPMATVLMAAADIDAAATFLSHDVCFSLFLFTYQPSTPNNTLPPVTMVSRSSSLPIRLVVLLSYFSVQVVLFFFFL